MIDTTLDWLFEKVHGLGFSAAILTALVGWASTKEDASREIGLTLGIWAATVAFYRLGGRLDKIVYDKLFGVDGKWSSVLDDERKLVRKHFEELGWPQKDIQKTSLNLFERTTKWEKTVKLSYELSKAARTFIVPLLLLLVYEVVGWPLGDITPEFRRSPLGQPELVAIGWLAAVCLFLALRVRHNRRLYGLVIRAPIFGAVKSSGTPRMIVVDEVVDKDAGVLYRFTCVRVNQKAAAAHRAGG